MVMEFEAVLWVRMCVCVFFQYFQHAQGKLKQALKMKSVYKNSFQQGGFFWGAKKRLYFAWITAGWWW